MFTVPANVSSLSYSRPHSDLKCHRSYYLFAFPLFGLFFPFLNVFNHGVWQCLDELSDPTLRSLASRLESTVIASRVPGTTDAYRRAFLRWKVFASSKREICTFPAKSEHVALYLQHLLNTTHSHSAVDSAIFRIQWAHHLAGLPSPTDSPIIQAVSRAAKRIMGTRVCKRKEPVSPDMIWKLVEKSNLDNLLELRNVCILILAFAAFFRTEEVLHIINGDISFHSDYLTINVDRSKTDKLRKGSQV